MEQKVKSTRIVKDRAELGDYRREIWRVWRLKRSMAVSVH